MYGRSIVQLVVELQSLYHVPYVPTGLEENNFTTDDINHSNSINVTAESYHDTADSLNPLGAFDDVETELLYHESDLNVNLSQESPISLGKNRNVTSSKRKWSLIDLLPTRKSARTRADNYSHSEVNVRK